VRARATSAVLPEHLRATYNLLQSAFPHGLAPESYMPLLTLLGDELSDRNLAEVMACAFEVDHEHALNDIYRARSTDAPSAEAVEKLKQTLLPYGYEKWLREQ
jgi:hypothetical protein